AHGEIADVVPIDSHGHLPIDRQGMEARRFSEGLADQGLGHAVVDDEVETDLGQRKPQLGGRMVRRTGLIREVGPKVDNGDGLRGRAPSAACCWLVSYTAS